MNIFTGPVRPPGRHRRHSHVDRELERFAMWNAANDPINWLEAAIDGGQRTITPFLAGMYGPDMPRYTVQMDRAIHDEGYGVQRHGGEQWGYEGFMPMLVKRGGK